MVVVEEDQHGDRFIYRSQNYADLDKRIDNHVIGLVLGWGRDDDEKTDGVYLATFWFSSSDFAIDIEDKGVQPRLIRSDAYLPEFRNFN